MPETRLSNPRKRRYTERLTPLQNEPSPHISKKQKRSPFSGRQIPPAFWKNLSKVHLTRSALEELNWRNHQAAPKSQPHYLRSCRRNTRQVFAGLKNSTQPQTPAVKYFCLCGTQVLQIIKQTARRGGPDLSDLRGRPSPSNPLQRAMNSSRSSSRAPKRSLTSTPGAKASTNTSKSTGPYDRNFQQNLVDGGIFPTAYRYPNGEAPRKPDNWVEINRRLTQPRPSLSPTRFSAEEYEKFVQADADAVKEKQVTTSVIPIVEGDVGEAKCVSGGLPFTNLGPLTDGTLVPGNPDIYYGARPEQLHRQVRDELSSHIIPSTQDDLPISPNFFLAAKGPDGSLAVASRQACYDGALGARGMHSLQLYGQEK